MTDVLPGSARRPIVLLVNPVAGGKPASGPALADEAELEPDALAAKFRERGLTVDLRPLGPDDDAAALARDAIAAGSDVVVGGGDGTVGQVAAALTGHDATLGILSMGSFNNIARGIGVPDELDAAVDVIVNGRSSQIDVGSALRDGEDRLFFEAAGVGLDAAGFGAVQLTTRHGFRRGLRAAWRAIRWTRRRMVIELDGRRRLRTAALLVTVSNGPYYGFGFTVAGEADLGDGLFEVSIFRKMSKLDLIRHFVSVARGRRQYEPRIRQLRAARVRISGLHRSLPAHVDGQLIGTTPVDFEVRQGALRVFR